MQNRIPERRHSCLWHFVRYKDNQESYSLTVSAVEFSKVLSCLLLHQTVCFMLVRTTNMSSESSDTKWYIHCSFHKRRTKYLQSLMSCCMPQSSISHDEDLRYKHKCTATKPVKLKMLARLHIPTEHGNTSDTINIWSHLLRKHRIKNSVLTRQKWRIGTSSFFF
jgi:hypothetical protein